MMRLHRWYAALGVASALALVGCSEDGDKPKLDGGAGKDILVFDGGLPDGFIPWPCETPGQACNAHNPCAIDPICGADKMCRPSKMQNCSDGLDCTDDICKGMGLCDNVPKTGYCALPVKVGGKADAGSGDGSVDAAGADAGTGGTTEIRCFKKDDKSADDPCQICEPDTSKVKWTGATGGTCDDKTACTKDDYCQAGTCKGTYYGTQCADTYGCTDDVCDGKGGCLGNPLKSNYCLINGACYKDKEKHPAGSCNICDVSKSQNAWTAITNTCLIDNKCYLPGDKDSTSCSTCDPTKSTTAWTPLPGLCKIDGKCYKQGDVHTGKCAECDTAVSSTAWTVKGSYCLIANVCKNPKDADTTGCGECDPTKSKTAWTAVSNKCLIGASCYADQAKDSTGCLMCDYVKNPKVWTPVSGAATITEGFEGGKTPTGWTLTNSDTSVGWVVTNKRPSGGTYSLYYGDPATGDYDSGATNSGTAKMVVFTPTAAKKAGLRFMLYMDVESGSSYDELEVQVNGTAVWTKDSTTVPTMAKWMEVTIDLSKYAGTAVTITFKFDTSDSMYNTTEGVYIDDITIYHNC